MNRYCCLSALFLSRILLLLAIASPVWASSNDREKDLIFSIHPYLPEGELIKRFTPLVEFLESDLGLNIELRISKNYETHIEHVGNNIADIAYLGPSAYVELSRNHNNHKLLARLEINGKPTFHGYVVSREDSGITNLSQLKGKRFAFGSPHSTMSYLVPKYMLKEAGISLDLLADYKFLGNHRNVALGVLVGEYDAGAIKEEVYLKLKNKGLRMVAKSPAISEHVFVSHNKMPQKTYQAIRTSLLKLNKANGNANILESIKKGVSGLVPASSQDYDNLRMMMQ